MAAKLGYFAAGVLAGASGAIAVVYVVTSWLGRMWR